MLTCKLSHLKPIRTLCVTLFVACLVCQLSACSPAFAGGHPRRFTIAQSNRATLAPLHFEPNVGQRSESVKFLVRGAGYTVALGPKYARFSFATANTRTTPRHFARKPAELSFAMQFANTSPRVQTLGEQPFPGVINYCIGADKTRWRLGVRPLGKVRYKNLYKGVDALFYGNPRQLEYDFVIAPQANPGQIRLRFSGLQKVLLTTRGDLKLRCGGKTALWHKPIAYQKVARGQKRISANYRIASDGTIGFQLGKYDRKVPLVIDPVFTYSSFLGGNGEESGAAIAVDAAGAAYVTGSTTSASMAGQDPTKIKGTYVDGYDVFVTKTDTNGNLVYTTYWGSAGDEIANAITLDNAASPSVFITGSTTSNDSTNGLSIPSFTTPFLYHVFVVKLNPTGLPTLSWQFGGTDGDEGSGIAYRRVNATSENIYVVGDTGSTDFPTQLAWQPASKGGSEGFLACYNISNGSSVTFTHSTYIGGTGDDVATCVAVDANNLIAVGGYTNSAKFPTTRYAAQRYPKGGYDGFVMRFAQGTLLLAPRSSTLWGGQYDDYIYDIAIDNNNVAYITGKTFSDNFPVSADAQQPFLGGWADAFVSGLNADGSALYSTYLGGEADDSAQGITLINSTIGIPPTIYLTGYTYSGYDLTYPFPTVAAEQVWGGEYDAFLTVLAPDRSIRESTVMGGTQDDVGLGVAVNPGRPGEWWIVGTTQSSDLATSDNAISGTFSPDGATEAFVTRYVTAPRLVNASLSGSRITAGTSVSATVTLSALPPKPVDIRYVLTDADGNTYRDLYVPVSALSTTFKLDIPALPKTTDLIVTVSFLTDSQDLTLRVVVPRLKALTFDKPTVVFSGQSLTGTITLDRLVGIDTTVLLSLSNPGARVPASVIVKKGASTAKFVVTTRSGIDINPVLKAQLGSSVLTQEIGVLTPRQLTLTLDKSSIKGGATDSSGLAQLTVAIAPAAPNWANGLQITFAATVNRAGVTVAFTPTSTTIAPRTSVGTVAVRSSATPDIATADLEASLYSKIAAITLTITQ